MDRESSPSVPEAPSPEAPVDVLALCERVRSAAREAGTAVRAGWVPNGLTEGAPDRPEDPDHHLWRNGGVFWIAFTVHAGVVQERVRFSLGTPDRALARRRRDAVLALFARARDLRISLRFRPRGGERRREPEGGRRLGSGDRRSSPAPKADPPTAGSSPAPGSPTRVGNHASSRRPSGRSREEGPMIRLARHTAILLGAALALTPAAEAGPRGGGGGRAGGGLSRGGAGLPGGLSGPGARPTPGTRSQPGALGGRSGGALGGAGALSGASPRSGTGPLGGVTALGGGALGAGAAGGSLGGARDGRGGDAAPTEGPGRATATRDGSGAQGASGREASSTQPASTSTTTASSEDGVTGPRGGSVDVDQTTTSDSVTTTVNAESASGETATHTGTWTQEDGYVTYDGSGSTSTGRNSETHGAAAMTDSGLVVGGTTTNNQGSAAGVALVNENGVTGAAIATNGESVAVVTPASAAAGSYYVYPVPTYGATVVTSTVGYPIYWWPVTPVVAATVALANPAYPATVEAYYSPVVTYATPSVAVYATTYAPRGLYAEPYGDRYYWVPGAAVASAPVQGAITTASRMSAPTSGGTVVAYDLPDATVFLTDAAPLAGTYERTLGSLHAWIPGVTAPTAAQADAIGTAVTAHAQGGSDALASAAARAGQGG